MNKNYYCVIMAGGVGSRFWPMSRTSQPKQFIDILGTGESLLQQTFNRFAKVCPKENILIATNEIYKDIVKKQLPMLTDEQILCEPNRRNTAPCIAYANYKIKALNPNATVVVSPSDHVIVKENIFTEVITSALHAAANNEWLITLGIKPGYPNTGYGYIQFDENVMSAEDNRIKKVKTFTEKPNLEMANSFIESGDFLWNAGIFIWSLKSAMQAIKLYLPEVDEVFVAGEGIYNTQKEKEFINTVYPSCKSISIDYGVMEKAKNVYVIASDFGWSDLGTWGALYDYRTKNEEGNSVVGKNVMLYDTKNCIVNMPKEKLVVLQGLDDYIVVEDNNILLVCRKSEEQQIRQIVNDIMVEKGDKFI